MNKLLTLVITSAITLAFSVGCAFGAQVMLTSKLPTPQNGRQIALEEPYTPETVQEHVAVQCL